MDARESLGFNFSIGYPGNQDFPDFLWIAHKFRFSGSSFGSFGKSRFPRFVWIVQKFWFPRFILDRPENPDPLDFLMVITENLDVPDFLWISRKTMIS